MNLMKIAYRNVSRQKRRSNLLALAIAFGVMMIILVNSLTQGLVQNTEKNFESALGGHIYLTGEVKLDSGKIANQISDPQILDAVIPQFSDYIANSQKRSTISGDFIFHSKSTTSILYGVHWDAEQALIDSMEVVAGSLDRLGEKGAIVLPQEVAKKIGVEVNEGILIRFSTVTGQANVGDFTVVAITKDTMGLGIAFAYADIAYVNELVGLAPGEYQSYNLTLKNIALINLVSNKIKQALIDQGANLKPVESESDSLMSQGGMSSAMFGSDKKEETWVGTRFNVGNLNDYMDMVQQIISILNGIALGVFLIMLLITMVGLMNTFRMIMIERTREIGTMRAIGMQRKDVSRLFLLEGMILALRGIFYGVVAELVIATVLHLIRFADGSSFAIILNQGHIAVPFVFSSILTITLIILFITLIAVLSPARKAAKLQPADALRS